MLSLLVTSIVSWSTEDGPGKTSAYPSSLGLRSTFVGQSGRWPDSTASVQIVDSVTTTNRADTGSLATTEFPGLEGAYETALYEKSLLARADYF